MLLVDTNVWLATADRASRHHDRCASLVRERVDELASTVPVIAETAWLLLDRAGATAQSRFLAAITSGTIAVVDFTATDWIRVQQLVTTYADAALDVIDASTIAAAERLNQTEIATLDERDFRIVRPNHTTAFTLLPGTT